MGIVLPMRPDDMEDLGMVRLHLERLISRRISRPFDADHQALYDDLCAAERKLIKKASARPVRAAPRTTQG